MSIEPFRLIYATGDGMLRVQGNARGDGVEFHIAGSLLGLGELWILLDEFATRDFLLALRSVPVPPVIGPAER